jgi:hypothetical protein
MTNQTDHDRARILDAHDARAQEAYWGGEPDEEDTETSGDALTPTYKWALSKAENRGKGYGLMAAYDALRERLSQDDRLLLLNMAVAAFTGDVK